MVASFQKSEFSVCAISFDGTHSYAIVPGDHHFIFTFKNSDGELLRVKKVPTPVNKVYGIAVQADLSILYLGFPSISNSPS